ncbi:hypothetical protein FrEUN1fDRAFT_6971 [Parafrankia sp. EUN1f]|nr:hypothetical protein FrEUN1fDRAFT_6971 [Parafrankia sp. EUN1f]
MQLVESARDKWELCFEERQELLPDSATSIMSTR